LLGISEDLSDSISDLVTDSTSVSDAKGIIINVAEYLNSAED
jgi:hypothetical protein